MPWSSGMTDKEINTGSIGPVKWGPLIVDSYCAKALQMQLFIVMYSNCNLFPGKSKVIVASSCSTFSTWKMIPPWYYHISGYNCVASKQFPPHNIKTSFKRSLGLNHRERVICIHSSVEHHQTGNREVFTALPGGCARTGFSHSRRTEWRDCRRRCGSVMEIMCGCSAAMEICVKIS